MTESKWEARRVQDRQRRIARKDRLRTRRAELVCFWTWPFGHIWTRVEPNENRHTHYCRFCPAKKYPPAFD